MKLTKSQQEVVNLMKDGFVLSFSYGFKNNYCNLIKGDNYKKVNLNVFNSLFLKKIIIEEKKLPYKVTIYEVITYKLNPELLEKKQ